DCISFPATTSCYIHACPLLSNIALTLASIVVSLKKWSVLLESFLLNAYYKQKIILILFVLIPVFVLLKLLVNHHKHRYTVEDVYPCLQTVPPLLLSIYFDPSK